jgi:hypothetical protein
MRARLLAQVRERVQQFIRNQDPASVLDPAAIAELEALVATVNDPTEDPNVAHVAGWLHWVRYLALDPGDDQPELSAALYWFAIVYRAEADAVPDQLRAHFDRDPRNSLETPDVLAHRAITLLRDVRTVTDPVATVEVIDLLRRALATGPSYHPDRAAMLSSLGNALNYRFGQNGDLADLDAAIAAGEEAVKITPGDHPRYAALLSNLGAALQTRFDRIGDERDLDLAIRNCEGY